MRGLALVVLAGCGTAGEPYLSDATYRRAVLESSLVSTTNAYAQLRLAHYARDWEALPEWNPEVSVDGDVPRALDLNAVDLGAQAFVRYPAQRADALTTLDRSALGLSHGVVTAHYIDGSQGPALSCAACHAKDVDGTLVLGLSNDDVDLGTLYGAPWPRGQLDVSAALDEAPVAIPDLRAASLEENLQASGEVRNGRIERAIRIETLLLTSHGGVVRPPREVALALADYLATLAPPVSAPPSVFVATCGGCHAGEALSGPPVDASIVGTDPRAATSLDRGTGSYRVPSLRGVSARGHLMHDASIASIDVLLDPSRDGGHRFGLALLDADRAAIVSYLRSL